MSVDLHGIEITETMVIKVNNKKIVIGKGEIAIINLKALPEKGEIIIIKNINKLELKQYDIDIVKNEIIGVLFGKYTLL